VGCDGVHSQVRGLLRELALAASVNLGNAEKPMVAHYQILAGRLRRIPHLPAKRLWEVRAHQANMQLFMLENDGWFLVYRRLPQPEHEYHKYTDSEAEAFGNDFADCPVTKELTFRDFWAQREWVALFNAEEGFLKTWHWDRVVLLGDAVHKMTPNAGLSLNAGWQGVVALTNCLSRLLATNPIPDAAALSKVFNEYQTKTAKRVKQSLWLSQMYIRVTAWDNLMWKIADHLGPYLGGDPTLFKMLAAPIVRNCMILDDQPEPNFKEGKIPWVNRPHKGGKPKRATSSEGP
jgi:2-polyprenyl-6-methoxyphenol hydroxylase-like FAD-dependent oxidoreductase